LVLSVEKYLRSKIKLRFLDLTNPVNCDENVLDNPVPRPYDQDLGQMSDFDILSSDKCKRNTLRQSPKFQQYLHQYQNQKAVAF
jgi:hypothetical protein